MRVWLACIVVGSVIPGNVAQSRVDQLEANVEEILAQMEQVVKVYMLT